MESVPDATLQEADLEVRAAPRPQVTATHGPYCFATGDVPRRALRAHPPRPLRRLPSRPRRWIPSHGEGEYVFKTSSSPEDIDIRIIRRYKALYDAFFEERDLIPDGQFHEISFEDLERDPVAQIRGLYEHLGIPGFEAFRPSLENYVSANSGYRKNEYQDAPRFAAL